jgi:hypothetical protein
LLLPLLWYCKGTKENKILTGQACDNKSLKNTLIYQIIKEVKGSKNTADQVHSNFKKIKRTEGDIAAVAAVVKDGRL